MRHYFSNALKRKVFVFTAVVIISSTNTLYLLQYLFAVSNTRILFYLSYSSDDISCHNKEVADDLPSADDQRFSPPEKSIFFLETSCKGGINSRQACAIESAARANPEWQINVLFAEPVHKLFLNGRTSTILQQLANVKLARIHVLKFSNGTPLWSFFASNSIEKSCQFSVHHASSVLSYLTLYKFGGVYLDLDIVVVKGFRNLSKNWMGRETQDTVGAGALAISKDGIGRMIATAAIREIKINYNPETWNENSATVITNVLKEICSTSNVTEMSATTCQGFDVYSEYFFYPIHYNGWRIYFETGEPIYGHSYIHHLWNKLSHQAKVRNDHRYAKLAEKFCPKIYCLYGDDFGS